MNWKRGAVGVSAAGAVLIAAFEGFSALSEQPLPGDKWTVGFGHTENVEPGQQVALPQALGMLKGDLELASKTVTKYVRVPMTQNQFDALTSLVFNIGSASFVASTLLKKLNAGDMDGVDTEWMRWKYFHGVAQKGLENRRAAELAVFHGKPIEAVVGDRLCFAGLGCFSYSDLLQEAGAVPDAADYGD